MFASRYLLNRSRQQEETSTENIIVEVKDVLDSGHKVLIKSTEPLSEEIKDAIINISNNYPNDINKIGKEISNLNIADIIVVDKNEKNNSITIIL